MGKLIGDILWYGILIGISVGIAYGLVVNIYHLLFSKIPNQEGIVILWRRKRNAKKFAGQDWNELSI